MTRTGVERVGIVLTLLFGLAATPSSAQVEAERWTFAANLRQTFTDNLFLISEGPGDAISGATLSLSYGRLDPRYSLSAVGWANGQLFNQYGSLNGVQFGLGASFEPKLSRRVRLRLGGSYADGLNLETLYASRVGLPQLDLKSVAGVAGLSYELTPSTSGTVSFDVTGVRYQTDQLVNSGMLPGDTLARADLLAPLLPSQPLVPAPPEASSQALALLTAEGVQTLRLDYLTWRIGTGLSHDFSAQTRVTVGFGYRRTYESPLAFAEGDQIEATAGLRRVLDQSANLTLSYAYQDNNFQPDLRIHTFQAHVDKQFSQEFTADAALGGSHLEGPSSTTSGWAPVGGVGLSLRLKRTTIAARYDRTQYQGLIVGRSQVADLFYGLVSQSLTRRLFLSAFGYYREAGDQFDSTYAYDTILAGASVGARIKKRGSAGVNYTFARFHAGSSPAASRSAVSVFLGYARTNK
ncbi:MAG TPA: hypothetical protein VN461_23130 [Vicinamibacteria bacterium]|jgi:hypothetical protein|nr:hypothetical protein [Vicinamibacteria bacterium]